MFYFDEPHYLYWTSSSIPVVFVLCDPNTDTLYWAAILRNRIKKTPKGSMDSMELRGIEKAKIACAKKLFNEMSDSAVKYHEADSYEKLLEVMHSL